MIILVAVFLVVVAFCIYLLAGGNPEDEVFHRIRREEGDSL